jgi:hypothetical protein
LRTEQDTAIESNCDIAADARNRGDAFGPGEMKSQSVTHCKRPASGGLLLLFSMTMAKSAALLLFATEQEAQAPAHRAALRFIEYLDDE